MGLSWSSESRKFHQFNSFSLILLHNVHNMLSHPKSALLTEGIFPVTSTVSDYGIFHRNRRPTCFSAN